MSTATDSARKRLFLWRNKRTFHSGFERTSPTPQTRPVRDPVCPAFQDPAHIRAHQIVMARNEILRNNPVGSFSYFAARDGGADDPARMPKMWTSRQAHSCEACNPGLRSEPDRKWKARPAPPPSPKITVSSEQIEAMSDADLAALIRTQAVEVAKLAGYTPPPSPVQNSTNVRHTTSTTNTNTITDTAVVAGETKARGVPQSQASATTVLPSSPSMSGPTPAQGKVAPDTIKQRPQPSIGFQPPLVPSTNYMTASITNAPATTVVNLRHQLSMSLSREMVLRDRLAKAGMFNRELLLDAAAAVNARLEQAPPAAPSSDQVELFLVPDGRDSLDGSGGSYSAVASSSAPITNSQHMKHSNREPHPHDMVGTMTDWANELDYEVQQLQGGPRVYDTLADPHEFYLQRSRYYQDLSERQRIEREERELIRCAREELAHRRNMRAEAEYLNLVNQIDGLIAEVRSPRFQARTKSPSRRLDEQALRVAAAQQRGDASLTLGEQLRSTLRLSSPSTSRLRPGGKPGRLMGTGVPALKIQAPFFRMSEGGEIAVQ
jgi:hypothetical protein